MSALTINLNDAKNGLKHYFGELFDITDKRINEGVRHGISQAINAIKKQTNINIASMPYKMTIPTKKYGVALIQGVNAYMQRGKNFGAVDILGHKYNDGTWMLRFFAGKGARRKKYGSIKGYMSLQRAFKSTNPIQYVEAAVKQKIDEINTK